MVGTLSTSNILVPSPKARPKAMAQGGEASQTNGREVTTLEWATKYSQNHTQNTALAMRAISMSLR